MASGAPFACLLPTAEYFSSNAYRSQRIEQMARSRPSKWVCQTNSPPRWCAPPRDYDPDSALNADY